MSNRIHVAYTWHGSATWKRRLAEIEKGDIVILNPSNGPVPDDVAEHKAYMNLIEQVRQRRATPVGYVDLGYDNRPARAVVGDVWTWWQLYGLGRLFFDQVPSTITSNEVNGLHALCHQTWASAYAKINLVLNCGTVIDPHLITSSGALIVTSEGPTVPTGHTWKPWEAAIANASIARAADGPAWQAWSNDTGDDNPYDGE